MRRAKDGLIARPAHGAWRRAARRSVAYGLCAVLALAGVAPCDVRAEPEPAADVPAPLAHEYLARLAGSGEKAALESARAADADPWVLVEELLLLGKKDEARAVANAGIGEDGASLVAYLSRAPVLSPDLARAVARAEGLLAGGPSEEALTLLRVPDPPALTVTEVRVERLRARALDALARPVEAGAARRRLASRAGAIGWRRAEIEAQVGLLDVTRDDRAGRRATLARLLAIDQDARDPVRSAGWCSELGHLEAERGDTGVALAWLAEADALYEAAFRSGAASRELLAERARCLGRLSDALRDRARLSEALAAALRAQDAASSLGAEQRAEAARAVGESYRAFGRTDEAETYYRRAEEAAREAHHPRYAQILGDLARVCFENGKDTESRALYDRVLTSGALAKEPRLVYVQRLHRAATAVDAPADLRSVDELQRALLDLLAVPGDLDAERPEPVWRPEIEASAQCLTARAQNLLGRSGEAVSVARTLLEGAYARRTPGVREYAEAELAFALRDRGKPADALAASRDVVDRVIREAGALPSSLALARLSERRFGELIGVHLANAHAAGGAVGAVAAFEETRGGVFLREADRRRATGAGSTWGGAPLEIAALAKAVATAAREQWKARADRDWREETSARTKLWELRMRLRAARERESLSAKATEDAPTGMRVRGALRADEAFLYVGEAGDEVLLALWFRERATAVRRPGLAELLDDARKAREAWMSKAATAAEGAAAFARLADALVPKGLLASAAADVAADGAPAHVYVSASGPLAGLPWSLLVDVAYRRDGGKGPAPTVSRVASRAVLGWLRTWNPPAGDGPILAVGDPDYTADDGARGADRSVVFPTGLLRLRASRGEVEAITSADHQDLVLLDADASEAMVRRALFAGPYPFAVLHLSCHGRIFGGSPWLSGLALHPEGADDGLLTVEEVGEWMFQGGPRLVVLAACESGLGSPVPGEGEEGLVRAFLLAGARQVVASLWNVPDGPTRRVMEAFHRFRREGGVTTAAALRRAQEAVRASGIPGDDLPRAWAGWAVWGPRD